MNYFPLWNRRKQPSPNRKISKPAHWLYLGFLSLIAYGALAHQLPKHTLQKESTGFIENKGQIKNQHQQLVPQVKYLLNGTGLNVQLRTNGFSYDTYIEKRKHNPQKTKKGLPDPKDITRKYHRVDISFVGANPRPTLVSEQQAKDPLLYYLPNRENPLVVHHYGKVTYKDLYPGIDLEFVTNPGTDKPIEYNFIVHPGANPDWIKWKYDGATRTALKKGKIIMDLAQGQLAERIPSSFYQEQPDQKVAVRYTQQANTFGFDVPDTYHTNKTLVIDPTPDRLWGTYYGTASSEQASYISTDTGGNIYMVGYSLSASGLATAGSHQENSAGSIDVVLVKFNSAGVRQWATYFGGNQPDYPYDLYVDNNGNAFIAGMTQSNVGIATAGVYQTFLNDTQNGFLVKFNSNGVRQWGTYYPASTGQAVAVDPSGNVFLGGIVTFGIDNSGFIAKFNSTATTRLSVASLSSGSFSGVSFRDYVYDLAIDAGGNVYVTGEANGPDLDTPGAYQTQHGAEYAGANGASGTTNTAYLVKYDNALTKLWGTYYGDTNGSYGYSVAVDNAGDIYLAGAVQSPVVGTFSGLPITNGLVAGAGAHQPSPGSTDPSNFDAFLAKFNAAGTRLWGTYYGGSSKESGSSPEIGVGIATDASNNVYLFGETQSATMIATTGAYQTAYAGGSLVGGDAFLAKFNPFGVRQWGTYYGGSGTERTTKGGVSVSGSNIYISGYTESTSGIASSGTHQTTNLGGDNFLAKFAEPQPITFQCGSTYTVNSLFSGGTMTTTIREVNLSTGATTVVGTLPNFETSAMALGKDPATGTNAILLVDGAGFSAVPKQIYKWDGASLTATGSAFQPDAGWTDFKVHSFANEPGSTNYYAVVSGNGVYYLYKWTGTGNPIKVGPFGTVPSPPAIHNLVAILGNDIVVVNGKIMMVNVNGWSYLIEIDPITLAQTVVCQITNPAISGATEIQLAYYDGFYYVGIMDGGGNQDIHKLDPATCMATLLTNDYASLVNPGDLASLVCATEICANGIDDDGDGLVDCADPDCVCSAKRGDCNGDGVVNNADLTAIASEIFDGDGTDPKNAGGGTHVGTCGCDANGDNKIDAGDASCAAMYIADPSTIPNCLVGPCDACQIKDAGVTVTCTPPNYSISCNPTGANLSGRTFNITGDITGSNLSFGSSQQVGTVQSINGSSVFFTIQTTDGKCKLNVTVGNN